LLLYLETSLSKLVDEASFISRFQKSRPDHAVDFNGSTDDLLGNAVELVSLVHRQLQIFLQNLCVLCDLCG